jgi:hypothetical protein
VNRIQPLLAAACLLVPVAACASTGTDAVPSRTVTVTTTTGSASPSAASGPAASDVRGRAHDAGQVRSVTTVDGTVVVELDRYTVEGTSDDTLAAQGITVAPHTGELFSNQNPRTYTIPLAPGAQLVVNECVVAAGAGALGLRSTPHEASSWLRDGGRDVTLLVTLDDRGRATRLDTDPRCA